MIKVTELNKYYNKGKSNELHVINNTSLELPDTGLICILGESGSGKTTLMNTISGLDDFENGIIDVDGVQVKKYGDSNQERVRNEKFGYIFQNYYLLQDRTVEYNLMISLGLYNISEEEKAERIDYVLKAVDMWRYKKRLVSQLSGGQQQRIAIARALAKSPKVIFADEPTGNLDEANTMRTMGVLKKISKNCLVVVVTHEKSIAEFFADRILFISDGQIKEDRMNTSRTSYQFIEDTNLYLGEYDKKEMTDENVNIEVYDNGQKPEIGIKLICDNGKIYISIGDAKNIEILTTESEKKVLEGKKPVLELTDVDDLDYSLGELEYAKKPKLSFKEIRSIALGNIKAMGKKQIFLVISLLAMAVMMVLAVQDIMTIVAVNEEDVVTTDSHYVEVKFQKGNLVSTEQFKGSKLDFLEALEEKSGIWDEVVMNPGISLTYTYSGFSQLENVKTSLSEFTFVPLSKLTQDDLYYGEMPKNNKEIVVDRWVLEKFVENSAELANVISNVKHFIGKTFQAPNGTTLKIVGISETEEMSIYIEKEDLACLTSQVSTFIDYTEFITNINPDYDGEELGYNEENKNYEVLASYAEYMSKYNAYVKSMSSPYYCISVYESALAYVDERQASLDRSYMRGDSQERINEKIAMLEEAKQMADDALEEMKEKLGVSSYEEAYEMRETQPLEYTYQKTVSTGRTYTVVGYYEQSLADEIGAEMILADEAKAQIMTDIMNYRETLYVYTDSISDTTDAIMALTEANDKNLNITISSPYEEVMEVYRADKAEQFSSRIIVTGTIFAVSMIILYFMMKTSAVQRMGDLAVYRLIGISKSSIIGLFAFENVVISSYTSLVGAVVSTLATYLISSIPSLGAEINYPWYAFLLTVAFLYLVNVVVGILPIRKILRIPPAQLATRYDI